MATKTSLSTKRKKSTDTPEHNAMQAEFLNDSFCMEFYRIAFPNESKEKDQVDVEEKITDTRTVIKTLKGPVLEVKPWRKNFEKDGIDVTFYIASKYSLVSKAYDKWSRIELSTDNLSAIYFSSQVKIEIVPIVGDDYPSILQIMQKLGANCLYLKDYNGVGVSEEKFIAMFKQQRITVVFEKNLKSK